MLSRQHAILLIVFLIVATIASYINRTPTGDDAWFAEQSFWMLEDGVIRSEFFRGLNGWDEELLVSHKLFLWFGAALMFLFGYDFPVVLFTGFIPFLALIGLLLFYLTDRKDERTSTTILTLLFLLFANRLLVKMSFQNRPEMLLAALGFAAFLLLFTGRQTAVKVMLGGMLSGLAFVAHMNGVIYLIAGFLTLALLKQYKHVFFFSVAGFTSSLLYLIDIIDRPDGFNKWLFQFTNDPAAAHGLQTGKKLMQLLTYPRLFFYSPEQIALSVLFVYVLWHQRQFLRSLPVALKTYTICLFLSFWLITKSNSGMYMVLFIPFILAILYEAYARKPFLTRGLQVCLAGYLAIGVFGMGQLIQKNWQFRDLPESYEALRKHLPEEGTGLVPLTFFFNEYEEYDQLLSHENYKLHYGKTGLSSHQMAVWSKKMDVDFILCDYDFLAEPYYPAEGQKSIPGYTLEYFDGRFAIYERD
jgi:hypothetical protein